MTDAIPASTASKPLSWLVLPAVSASVAIYYAYWSHRKARNLLAQTLREGFSSMELPSKWSEVWEQPGKKHALRRLTQFGVITDLSKADKRKHDLVGKAKSIRTELKLARELSVTSFEDIPQEEIIFVARSAFAQNEVLFDRIVALLNLIDYHRNYYVALKKKKIRRWLETGPNKWYGYLFRDQSVCDFIDSRIKLFHDMEVGNAVHLGRLKRSIAAFSALCGSKSTRNGWCLMEEQNMRQNVWECISMNAAFFSGDVIDDRDPHRGLGASNEDLLLALVENMNQFSNYEHRVLDSIYNRGKPGHMRRNWLTYSVLLSAASWSVFFLYQHSSFNNSQDLNRWTRAALEAGRMFVVEHLYEPFDNARALLFENRRLLVTDPAEALNTRASLKQMLFEFETELDPLKDKASMQGIHSRVQKLDMGNVEKQYELEIRAPVKNILFGNVVKMILIQMQQLKLDFHVMDAAMDKLIAENQLTAELAATIPAFVVISVITYGGIYIKRAIVSQEKQFEIMRGILRDAEKTLNRKTEKPVVEKNGSPLMSPFRANVETKQATVPSFEDEGMLVLWLSRFASLSLSALPAAKHDWVMEDLKEIASENLTAEQKLATIRRMYRTYHFLLPTPN